MISIPMNKNLFPGDFFFKCLSMYFYIVVCNGIFLQYLYFWPGHDIAAHSHTTFDAMALSKEKSIFILSIMDILGGGG